MKTLLRTALLSAVSLVLAGCGHISISYIGKKETSKHKQFRKQGYDLCHLVSCGPKALSDAFKEFNINKTPFQIGKELQDNDKSNYRKIVGVLNKEFYGITCPLELKKYIRNQGFAITEIKDLKKITSENTAIFLLKGKYDIGEWHWMTYPTNKITKIQNCFGKHTKIRAIYVLTRLG